MSSECPANFVTYRLLPPPAFRSYCPLNMSTCNTNRSIASIRTSKPATTSAQDSVATTGYASLYQRLILQSKCEPSLDQSAEDAPRTSEPLSIHTAKPVDLSHT
ncbi:unnamed protein product [Kuraishia capsulata CBS 1993]|uniref:Uncharacterized protein n=1 Tax=Kuraishia capsulata CBS 1993 TaxID=1382522 RepID=W6MVK0_9ASCO|nr:uncharacterized protein KUCA_T00002327001 [Kuraishia capsulata CBS 1993]CDK26355.1 unnamed protein product [Kuraishia capsulata CBS 1993]